MSSLFLFSSLGTLLLIVRQRIDFLRLFSSLLRFLYTYEQNFKFLGYSHGGLEAHHSLMGKATTTDMVLQDCSL